MGKKREDFSGKLWYNATVRNDEKYKKGETIMERSQFTFYRSFFESIEKMKTKKEKADAYRIICDYALNGNEPDLSGVSPLIATVFGFSKPVMDTAGRRSLRIKKNMAAHKLSEVVDRNMDY